MRVAKGEKMEPWLSSLEAVTFHNKLGSVKDKVDRVAALADGKTFGQVSDQLADLLAAFEAPAAAKAAGQEKGAREEPRVAAVFEAMPGAFQPEAAAGVSAVFQYRISGPGGGDWHCIVADRQCRVVAGQHDHPTCTLNMAAADFLAMMGGRLAPLQAFNAGKLHIEGDIIEYCSDKYQNNRDIQPSLLYKELNPEAERRDPQLKLPFGDHDVKRVEGEPPA